MSFEIGSTVGDYQIVQLLGAGGMGKVYKVRNVISDRIEAMKVLLPSLSNDADLSDRFMREIKVQARLDHPNIAALHTAQRIDGQLLMIMEFVEGQTIESILKEEKISLKDGIEYISQTLSALAYAHSHGVVHRDIKPANMMLTNGVVKLMDFGIAKIAADRSLTQTGRTVGSLYYMSPEQIQGAVTLDGRSDLYSLGITLYEIVTGARPFQGDSDFSIMAAHMQNTPLPPIQYNPHLPPALNEIMLMSIAREPEQRFQSADAFRNALSSVVSDLPAAEQAGDSKTVVFKPGMPIPAMPTAPEFTAPRMTKPISAPSAPQPPQPQPQLTRVEPVTTPPVFAQPQPGTVAELPSMPNAAPPAPPPPPSRRGLYMVVGSVVTVAILALAAFELPKIMKTGAASPGGGSYQITPAPKSGGAGQLPTDGSSATGTPDPTSLTPSQGGSPPQELSSGGGARPQTKPSGTAAVRQPAQPNRQQPVTQHPPQQPPAQQPTTQQPPAQPPPQAKPPAPDPAVIKAIEELRQRQSLLAIRQGAVRDAVNRLAAQQASSGLAPNGELTSAVRRIQVAMDQAAAQIRDGNADAAKRSLDAAERDVEKLEQRFNL